MRNHVHGNDNSSLRCDDGVYNTSCDFMYDLMHQLQTPNKTSDLSSEVSK